MAANPVAAPQRAPAGAATSPGPPADRERKGRPGGVQAAERGDDGDPQAPAVRGDHSERQAGESGEHHRWQGCAGGDVRSGGRSGLGLEPGGGAKEAHRPSCPAGARPAPRPVSVPPAGITPGTAAGPL